MEDFEEFLAVYMNADEDELIDFLINRLNVLDGIEGNDITSDKDDIIYSGYIKSDKPVETNSPDHTLLIDDGKLYLNFMHYLRDNGCDIENEYQLMDALDEFIGEQFGVNNTPKNNELVYLKGNFSNISIASFYNNNSALSYEKAIASQNILCFAGLNSYLVFGNVIQDGKTEKLPYSVIVDGRNLLIYDSENHNNNDDIKYLIPNVLKKRKDSTLVRERAWLS